ncbi:kelch motif-containing protein [Belliella sp. DSM 111904]|uniref:Kelch motif-containing protein n=1 Tax=Belliella filtrata TaxID=2923435 RepID=A0ABS9V477_9BACT|nr:kelch motif-containing protein [Belliella filtrata]
MNQDLRTSLNLTPKSPFDFSDGFSMEFEAQFRNGDGYFGFVYRVIADDKYNLDLVANLNTQKTAFWLVSKDSILTGFTWDELGGENYEDWLKIKLEVNPFSNIVSLIINDVRKNGSLNIPQNSLSQTNVFFGAHKTPHFVSTDVAPMKVRDIHFKNFSNQSLAYWKLERHRHNQVYDEIASMVAEVKNPNWDIDSHVNWKEVFDLSVSNKLGTAINYEESKLFVITRDELLTYDMNNSTVIRNFFEGGSPYDCRLNSFVYDQKQNVIISYAFDYGEPSILDLRTMKWSITADTCDLPKYWHHNRVYKDNVIYTFAGYGLYTFRNDLKKLNIEDQKWTTIHDSPHISPRYLSSLGSTDDGEVFIFGGYGSKSGGQHLDPHYYYDLNKVNLQTGEVEKYWDKTRQYSHHFVPVASMVPTEHGDGFYTLIYDNSKFETSLSLAKINFENSDFKIFSDSIPYFFRDIESWSDLYYFENKQRLVALITTEDQVTVSELAYPPLLPLDTFQKLPSRGLSFSDKFIPSLLLFLFILICLVLYFLIKKYWLKQKIVEENKIEKEILEPIFVRPKRSAIFFLGGFQAFDKEGKNLTAEFTPTLRQLFLIIYFYSSNNDKGVSSSKLNELIWPDKSDSSAKNNRNVNISKLRLVLEKIGDVRIDNDASYWKITIGEGVYDDFQELQRLIIDIQSETSHFKVGKLINMLAIGELCPNIQTEWMDCFKVKFSNLAIDTLFQFVHQNVVSETDLALRLSIAEAILIHDILNEDAIKLKCQVLFQMGKKAMAIQAFEKFSKEYERMIGAPLHMKLSGVYK